MTQPRRSGRCARSKQLAVASATTSFASSPDSHADLVTEGERYPVTALAANQHVDKSTASRWVSAGARARPTGRRGHLMRGHTYKRGKAWTVVYDEQLDETRQAPAAKQGRVPDAEGGAAVPHRPAFAARPRHVRDTEQADGHRLPRARMAARRRGHAAPAERPEVPAGRPALPAATDRLYAAAGAISGASERHVRRRSSAPACRFRRGGLVHAVIGRALRDAERWGRVPRNVARMADPPSRGASPSDCLDGRRAPPVPRTTSQGDRLAALVAARRDDRHAPRRARRR